jgi:hypothetical protein
LDTKDQYEASFGQKSHFSAPSKMEMAFQTSGGKYSDIENGEKER